MGTWERLETALSGGMVEAGRDVTFLDVCIGMVTRSWRGVCARYWCYLEVTRTFTTTCTRVIAFNCH